MLSEGVVEIEGEYCSGEEIFSNFSNFCWSRSGGACVGSRVGVLKIMIRNPQNTPVKINKDRIKK